jgi:1-acyl-sn-glycerol-3-phosphate acyltransferase
MQDLLSVLRSYLYIGPAVFGSTAFMGLISLVYSLCGASEDRLHRLAQIWSHMLLRLAFIRTEISGLEHLDRSQNYVFVANHASYFDTPVMIAGLPFQIRFFAKLGLFSIPLMGTHLGRAGHFPVDFDSVRASLKSMSQGARAIADKHVSVVIFPEGGRSLEHLEDFKEGAAYIAIKSAVPAVPVAIIGTREILKMHTTVARPGKVKLIIGRPIDTSHLKIQDRDHLTATLRGQIAEMLGEPIAQRAACKAAGE